MSAYILSHTGSICSINGYILVYTQKKDVTFHNSDHAVKVGTMSC